jgi:hypothetical protein
MKKTLLIAFTFLLIICEQSFCQQFAPTFRRFSGKKTAFLFLNSGEKISFKIKKIKRKKGAIVRIKGRATDGSKFKYRANDIKQAALPPTLLTKLDAAQDATESVVETTKTNFESLGKDLALYYQEPYRGQRKALLQLINPEFCTQIKVYADPRAKETSGVKVSGLRLTGGIDKSYYVNYKGTTTRIRKRNYNRYFKEFFGSCPALLNKYKDSAWRDLPNHIYFYEQNCQNQ